MKPQQYFSVTHYGTRKRGVVFMFGGWRFKRIWYMPGVRFLTKLGYETVLFVPRTSLVSTRTPLAELGLAARAAHGAVEDHIRATKREPNLEYIVMAVSLGTLLGGYVAAHTKQISKVVLTTPFGDFKAHVERWQSDRFFKRVIKRQPGGAIGAINSLSSILSVKEMERLAKKELYIYYADNDAVVHTEVTEAMIGNLEAKGLRPQAVVKVKGGHQSGVFRSYAHVMKSQSFIN